MRVSGLHCLVAVQDEEWRCETRGRLREGVRETTSPVVTGDWVDVCATGQGEGVVEEVLPRQSRISRVASGPRPYEQILVANLDQLIVVVATREPALSTGFIDRAVVMALSGDIEPVICINKVDLDPDRRHLEVSRIYADLRYEVLCTSAKAGEGMALLQSRFRDRVSAMVGPSGAGKSSLLNYLQPGLSLATRSLMRGHDRGRHTTTAAQLHRLEMGGFVADTPGIKQLKPWGITAGNLIEYFVEMAPLTEGCRFRDCSHMHEPGCAVREAVEAGAVHPMRYEGYRRMEEGLEAER